MSVKSKIQSLITAANEKTGESDTNLTDAVQTLCDGYGGGGAGEAPENDVIFIDYDGKRVYSYSAEEFLALSAFPPNPSHTDIVWHGTYTDYRAGLVAQGWNWDFDKAQQRVRECGEIVIGQNYNTYDGKTRMLIRIDSDNTDRVVWIIGTCKASINWGDGSEEVVVNSGGFRANSPVHTYVHAGIYCISIEILSGKLSVSSHILQDSTTYTGSTPADIIQSKLACQLAANTHLGEGAFGSASNIESVSMCNSQSNGSTSGMFNNFTSLCTGLAFSKEFSTSDAFQTNGFQYARSLRYVSFPYSIPNANTGNNMVINFDYCSVLRRLTLPSDLPRIVSFRDCKSLLQITIPSACTDINANSFNGCSALRKMVFRATTPPTVANANAFTNLPTFCEIHVPHGTLDAYKAATNYPSPSTYTYVEDAE